MARGRRKDNNNQQRNQRGGIGAPVEVTFYSLMGVEAARRGSGAGGAWRLWVLYRAMDPNGSGKIKRDDLRAFVLSLGVNRQTWARWYSEAMRAEMFKESRSAAGVWWMVFANAGIIGAALGCAAGVGRRVTMKAVDLVGYGWKARVYAAHENIYNGQPIARETIQKKINVARRTQQYREARAGVKKITNIVKLNMGADYLPGMIEHDRNPRAFFVDKDGTLNQRLPNSYQYKKASLSARGRGRKVNRIIRSILHLQQQSSLSKMGQAQSFIDADGNENTSDVIRLYNKTPDQTKATADKVKKTGSRINGVYEYLRKGKRARNVAYWFYVAL